MIYTVTFNPCLDYVVGVDNLTLGAVNRVSTEAVMAGGKGINVSIVLKNLGHASCALGFLAGFTGDEIARRLRLQGVDTDFIEVSRGMSRINVKVKSAEETEINGIGPDIAPSDIEALYAKLDALTSDDILVISGSVPAALPGDIYERIMERLESRSIRIVVDATRVAENGDVIESPSPKGTVVNSVGAGDSMVAGFIAGHLESDGNYEQAFRMGVCAGSASAFSLGLAERDQVEELLATIGS